MPARSSFSYGPCQLRKAALRKKSFKVAVLSKDSPAHNQILEGYLKQHRSKTSIEPVVTLIPAGLSLNEACEAARRIVNGKPDVIVPIGALCSQAVRYVLKKEGIDILLIHAAVERPEFLDLVPTFQDQFRATGITGGYPIYAASMHILSLLRSRIKHLLITYSVAAYGGSLTNAAALAPHYFGTKDIKVTVVPFFKDEMPMQRILPFLDEIDTVMCFEGCETQRYARALATECNRRGIFAFGGDIELIREGAACGFILDYGAIGQEVAKYVYRALWLETPLKDLPLISLGANARRIVINKKTVADQGLTFDEDVMHLITKGSVHGDIFLGDAGMLLGEELPEPEEF